MKSLRTLAVRVRVLSLDDSLGTAVEAIRVSNSGAVPVVQHGRLMGLVTSAILAQFLSTPESASTQGLRVGDLPLEPTIALPVGMSAPEALAFFRANGLERAPVVDGNGTLLGMVSTPELMCAVWGRVRPALVGGMATPFGVYLTGGGARGGAGDLALMSTGVYIAVLHLVAIFLTELLYTGGWWKSVLPQFSARLADPGPTLITLTWALLFATLFRLSWITGYHAAEHQVVHTLEAGEDLRPTIVRGKPRVHPRCGTNLVAAVLIMTLFWRTRWADDLQPVLAMVVTFFLWRRVGAWLQLHVTTRPPSPAQIENGIEAARQLIAHYQARPVPSCGLARRIWNMGLLQVMAGWALVLGLLALLQLVVPLPESLRIY